MPLEEGGNQATGLTPRAIIAGIGHRPVAAEQRTE